MLIMNLHARLGGMTRIERRKYENQYPECTHYVWRFSWWKINKLKYWLNLTFLSEFWFRNRLAYVHVFPIQYKKQIYQNIFKFKLLKDTPWRYLEYARSSRYKNCAYCFIYLSWTFMILIICGILTTHVIILF